MVNVSSVNKIFRPIGKFMDNTATGVLKKPLENARLEPARYAAKLLVLSFVSKDLINTCVYTYQSLNNKKIPEEKRNFVAANDLVLGFFNFFGQIYMQQLCDKHITPALKSRYTGKVEPKGKPEVYKNANATFAPDNIEKLVKDTIKQKQAELKGLKPENIKELTEYVGKKAGASGQKGADVLVGLGIVISSLATTAFIKRTISPLLSTPIAGWLGDRWDKKNAPKASENSLYKSIPIESFVLNSHRKKIET